MPKPPKWLYIAEYRCGCSEDSKRRNELLNYCAKHGAERIRIYKVPNQLSFDDAGEPR